MLSFCNLFPNAKAFGYNRAVNSEMPVVYIDGDELKREQYLKYLGITFDRSLCETSMSPEQGLRLVLRGCTLPSFKQKYVR